jgi:hypothetical protein
MFEKGKTAKRVNVTKGKSARYARINAGIKGM